MSVPAHKSLLVRNVVSMLSHRVYLKGTVVQGHPVVWSLALRSDDDAKQDPVVYGTKFSVVLLAEGSRTASIQKGFDCLGLYQSGLEGERDFRLIVEFP